MIYTPVQTKAIATFSEFCAANFASMKFSKKMNCVYSRIKGKNFLLSLENNACPELVFPCSFEHLTTQWPEIPSDFKPDSALREDLSMEFFPLDVGRE